MRGGIAHQRRRRPLDLSPERVPHLEKLLVFIVVNGAVTGSAFFPRPVFDKQWIHRVLDWLVEDLCDPLQIGNQVVVHEKLFPVQDDGVAGDHIIQILEYSGRRFARLGLQGSRAETYRKQRQMEESQRHIISRSQLVRRVIRVDHWCFVVAKLSLPTAACKRCDETRRIAIRPILDECQRVLFAIALALFAAQRKSKMGGFLT